MLSLQQASAIVDAALAFARDHNLRPLAVTVLDVGGHPIVVKREDHAGILRHEIAHAKAFGCLGMGQGGRSIAANAERSPTFFAALASISRGRITPSRGGVLVLGADGTVLGAVGVSGDRPGNDEAVAVAAIQSLGLLADAG